MTAPKKSLLYRTAYLRAIGTLCGCIGVIVIAVVNLSKDINDYPVTVGKIYESHLRWNNTPFSIKLNKSSHLWYRTYIEEYFDILQEKAVAGKSAKIWYEKDSHEIVQLTIEDEMIIPYYKNVMMAIIFLVLGTIIGIITLLYLIKNSSHLYGKLE